MIKKTSGCHTLQQKFSLYTSTTDFSILMLNVQHLPKCVTGKLIMWITGNVIINCIYLTALVQWPILSPDCSSGHCLYGIPHIS